MRKKKEFNAWNSEFSSGSISGPNPGAVPDSESFSVDSSHGTSGVRLMSVCRAQERSIEPIGVPKFAIPNIFPNPRKWVSTPKKMSDELSHGTSGRRHDDRMLPWSGAIGLAIHEDSPMRLSLLVPALMSAPPGYRPLVVGTTASCFCVDVRFLFSWLGI